MKKIIFFCFLFSTLLVFPQSKTPTKKIQIKTAVQAAPKMYRDQAKVWGYNQKGALVVLQKGNNEMVCLANDPEKDGFEVACYSKKLEPFMKRGRELKAKGKSEGEKRKIRKKEIDAGELSMPTAASALYVLTADQGDYNPETGELKNSQLRYVLYKPYMTADETGLPTKPEKSGMPWLMDADSPRSHIMISPKHN